MGGEPGAISCREKGSCREKDPARERGREGGRGSVEGYTFEQARNDQVGLLLAGYKNIRPHRQVVYPAK